MASMPIPTADSIERAQKVSINLYTFVDIDTGMCDHVFAVGGSGLNQGEKDECLFM